MSLEAISSESVEGKLMWFENICKLLEKSKQGDPKTIAGLIVHVSDFYYRNRERIDMPPEVHFIYSLLELHTISINDLRKFSEDRSIENARNIQVYLDRVKNLKMDVGAFEGRKSINGHEHNVFNPNQTVLMGWKRECQCICDDLRIRLLNVLRDENDKLKINELVKGFMKGFLEDSNSIIPDGLHSIILPINLEQSFRGPMESKAILLSPSALGIKGKELEKMTKQVEEIKTKKETVIHKFVQQWLKKKQNLELTNQNIHIIDNIRSIILENTHQVSENTYEWIINFAFSAVTQGKDAKSNELNNRFSFNTSIGGDQVPPIMPEGYIIEPLKKLAGIKKLFDEGLIHALPTFDIIGTLFSQLIENDLDHSGNSINPKRHIFNSIVTLKRLSDFVEKFFPDIKSLVNIHLFPAYSKESLARLYWGAITANLPISDATFNNLFGIKGNLQKIKDENFNPDFFNKLFDKGINIYPSRHMISNGLCSQSHTLRFGSSRTEPQFHLIGSICKKTVQQNHIAKYISEMTLKSEISPAMKRWIIDNLYLIKEQSLMHQQDGNLHSQIGMQDVHACYYYQQMDPSFNELLETGSYIPKTSADRDKKTQSMTKVFSQVSDHIGLTNYVDHIRSWADTYDSFDSNSTLHNLNSYADKCAGELQLRLMPQNETRNYLQHFLK